MSAIAPSDSSHYEYLIYTAPSNGNGATITATVTWASDWYPPPPSQYTSSFPNLVEISYLGGFGCDFIRNYPQNNFVEFQSGMDPTNPNATKTASITVGPGKAVAIAGSDCFFGDNFTFHTLVKWTVQLQGCQVALTVPAFRQTDPRWSADELGFGPYTIGGRGCAVSSLAMAQKFAGIESVFSP